MFTLQRTSVGGSFAQVMFDRRAPSSIIPEPAALSDVSLEISQLVVDFPFRAHRYLNRLRVCSARYAAPTQDPNRCCDSVAAHLALSHAISLISSRLNLVLATSSSNYSIGYLGEDRRAAEDAKKSIGADACDLAMIDFLDQTASAVYHDVVNGVV